MKRLRNKFDIDGLFDNQGAEYRMTGTIEADYEFIPGKMYMSNGDPGYPDDEVFDLDTSSLDAFMYKWNTDKEDWDTVDSVPEEVRSQLIDSLDDSSGAWEEYE